MVKPLDSLWSRRSPILKIIFRFRKYVTVINKIHYEIQIDPEIYREWIVKLTLQPLGRGIPFTME